MTDFGKRQEQHNNKNFTLKCNNLCYVLCLSLSSCYTRSAINFIYLFLGHFICMFLRPMGFWWGFTLYT